MAVIVSSGMWRRVELIRIDVSEEWDASIFKVEEILDGTNKKKKQTPWPLVRERTIPTEEQR
jgi:hypothetical protein